MTVHTLTLSTGMSRGRDTYGYRIVRLRDSATGKLYRCMGGGYDMAGTVLANWLTDMHQDALRAIADRAYYQFTPPASPAVNDAPDALYGLFHYAQNGRVSVDGACGVSSVQRIAEAAGVKLESLPSVRGAMAGWLVHD